MGFTYDLSATGNALTISKIRLLAGDSRATPYGLRPNGTNFDDAEVLFALGEEANINGRAAALLLEIAANEWSSGPENVRVGEHWEAGLQASRLRKRAEDLRRRYGTTNAGGDPTISVRYTVSNKED